MRLTPGCDLHRMNCKLHYHADWLGGIGWTLKKLWQLSVLVVLCCNVAHAENLAEQVEQCRKLRFDQPKRAVEVCDQAYQGSRADPAQAMLSFEMLSHRGDSELSIGDTQRARASFAELALIPLTPEQWRYRYRLLRRQAQLAFRSEQLVIALAHYQSALQLASEHQDQKFLSISHSDMGMTARRLGDYRQALKSYAQALQIQRQLPNPDLAPILNNIGDLYKDLQQYTDAENRYDEALAQYREQGKTLQIAHTTERLALVAEARGDLARAALMLQSSAVEFQRAGSSQDALRVRGDQIRLRLDAGELDAAQSLAQSLAARADKEMPARLALQLARLSRLSGQAQSSLAGLLRLKQRLDRSDQFGVTVIAEIGAHYSVLNDAARAAEHYQLALTMQRDFALKNVQADVAALRVALEVQENERVSAQAALTLAQSEAQLANERLARRSALFGGCLLLLSGFAFWLWERNRRARQLAAAKLRYQAAVEQLQHQADLQYELLEMQPTPVALVDAQGMISASNRAFDALSAEKHSGERDIAKLLPTVKASWAEAFGKADESEQPQFLAVLSPDGGAPRHIRIRAMASAQRGFLLDFSEDVALAQALSETAERLRAEHNLADPAAKSAAVDTEPTAPDPEPLDGEANQQFWEHAGHRNALVQLMLSALAAFERATGKTRIELAEQSKLWRVTVDDGRLRVRAMERYLTVSKLPKQPRWREVLRTAYFVLSHCQLANQIRADMEAQLQQIESALRAHALN